jgi:hypothetical protein
MSSLLDPRAPFMRPSLPLRSLGVLVCPTYPFILRSLAISGMALYDASMIHRRYLGLSMLLNYGLTCWWDFGEYKVRPIDPSFCFHHWTFISALRYRTADFTSLYRPSICPSTQPTFTNVFVHLPTPGLGNGRRLICSQRSARCRRRRCAMKCILREDSMVRSFLSRKYIELVLTHLLSRRFRY